MPLIFQCYIKQDYFPIYPVANYNLSSALIKTQGIHYLSRFPNMENVCYLTMNYVILVYQDPNEFSHSNELE